MENEEGKQMMMGVGFSLMSMVMGLMFMIVFGVIIVIAVKGISEWSSNNQQDVVSYRAKVAAKRQHVTHSTQNIGAGPDTSVPVSTSSTDYFVTFQDEHGARQEFRVKDRDYGLMAEGDTGTLSHQGTRFKGFDRDRQGEKF